jgi:hypothetical protein
VVVVVVVVVVGGGGGEERRAAAGMVAMIDAWGAEGEGVSCKQNSIFVTNANRHRLTAQRTTAPPSSPDCETMTH